MSIREYFDVFVGNKTGTFKGIGINFGQTSPITTKNIQSVKVLKKASEITALAWGDDDEEDILIGLANQTVKIYNSNMKGFSTCLEVSLGHGSIRGISRYNETLLTAVESGHVKIWMYSSEKFIDTGKPIEKMKHCKTDRHIIALGGKEHDLSLWNLDKSLCTFYAKNVKPDKLQLRQPVWVTDMCFLSSSPEIAVCTRYGQVRLYDPSIPGRRPVLDVKFPDEVFTTICQVPQYHNVIVGTAKGRMIKLDLRKKGAIVQSYKGATGGLKSIECHSTEPYVVSGGLDGHLRVHHLNSTASTTTPIHSIYMKSRVNCILVRSEAIYFKKRETDNDNRDNTHCSEDPTLENSESFDDDDDIEIVEVFPPIKRKKNE